MAQFEKNYIGKGSKVSNLDIVRVSISREKIEEILKNELVSYDGKDYLVFEVSALKQKDNYGRTHTAYISKKVQEETKPKPKGRKKTEKATV